MSANVSANLSEFVTHLLDLLEPFRYSKKGKTYQMSYHAAPGSRVTRGDPG